MIGLGQPPPTRPAGPPTVLVTAPYFPPEGGGLEAYALNVSRGLACDHGWKVVMVTSSHRGGRPTVRDEDGVRVYQLPAQVRISNTQLSLAWLGQLRSILNLERPDVINAHAPVPGMAGLVAGLAAAPLVVSWHAGSMRKGRPLPDAAIRPYESVLCRRLLSRAAWVIASSDSVRDTVLAPVRAKCTTLTPGIDTERFTPALARNATRVLFVGGLNKGDAHKGLVDVVHAVADLARSRSHLTLDVVGEGSERGAFDTLATCLGIGDRVRFRGRLTGEELVDAYRGAAMLVLPTTNDSFPLVLLEAMACGLPVVSTAVGDIGKLIDHGRTGYIVPTDSRGVLAQRVGELFDDPFRADVMGAAARRRALSSRSWDAQVARTNDLFGHVLAGRPPSGRRNLAVVAPYFPPKIGGLERYAEEIARGLVRRGAWDVTVFTANHAARRTTVEVRNGMAVHRLRPWLSVSNTPVNPMWWFYLRRAFRANRIDAVHVHTPVPYLSDLAGLAAGSRPLVVTYHAGSMIKQRLPIDIGILFYERLVLPRLLRRADDLVAVSSSVASTFFEGHREKTSIISPGVDTARFVPPAISAVQGPPIVLYVGKIASSAAWKGLGCLVDAFAIVVERVPEARLVLVGEGDAVDVYAAQAEGAGVGGSVDLLGELDGDDLVTAYQRATVVVLPSLTEAESFGMSLIEAMACGKPVVGSQIGGIPFVIDDGVDGLLVPPGDARAWADACLRLLEDRHLAGALGAAGRRKVVAHYRWTDQVERYAALLHDYAVDSQRVTVRIKAGSGRTEAT